MAIKLSENKNYMWGMLIIIAILTGVSVSLYLQTVSLNRQLTTLEAKGPPPKGDCPEPFVQDGNSCVLTKDEILTKTLKLSSGTTLDCRGFKLTPSARGIAPSGIHPMAESVPVAAVLLNDVNNVTVKNCLIDDFDFGVVAMGDKNASKSKGNTISDNTITSLYQGVTIIEADNIDVVGNNIQSKSPITAGIAVFFDSDSIAIKGNTIRNKGKSGESLNATPLVPGGELLSGFTFGEGIFVNESPRSMTIRVDGETGIFTKDVKKRAIDNLIENNSIIFEINDFKPSGIHVADLHDGLIIRGNFIQGAGSGISLHHQSGSDEAFFSRNILVENNHLTQYVFDGVSASNTINPRIEGNLMTSGVTEDFGGGISLDGKALEGAIVTRNVITDSRNGINLGASSSADLLVPAEFFGAKIYLNDFTDIRRDAISIATDYTFDTELSFQGQGNFWDRSCADSDGFLDVDEPDRSNKTDSPESFITDSHPYGQSVAGLSDRELRKVKTCE